MGQKTLHHLYRTLVSFSAKFPASLTATQNWRSSSPTLWVSWPDGSAASPPSHWSPCSTGSCGTRTSSCGASSSRPSWRSLSAIGSRSKSAAPSAILPSSSCLPRRPQSAPNAHLGSLRGTSRSTRSHWACLGCSLRPGSRSTGSRSWKRITRRLC